ncbi:hypothetical protein BHM03_00056566 [Ensete ventricosum]|nr:hypothetical protein BHM03_00056566 [Ensete ventricosum]
MHSVGEGAVHVGLPSHTHDTRGTTPACAVGHRNCNLESYPTPPTRWLTSTVTGGTAQGRGPLSRPPKITLREHAGSERVPPIGRGEFPGQRSIPSVRSRSSSSNPVVTTACC